MLQVGEVWAARGAEWGFASLKLGRVEWVVVMSGEPGQSCGVGGEPGQTAWSCMDLHEPLLLRAAFAVFGQRLAVADFAHSRMELQTLIARLSRPIICCRKRDLGALHKACEILRHFLRVRVRRFCVLRQDRTLVLPVRLGLHPARDERTISGSCW